MSRRLSDRQIEIVRHEGTDPPTVVAAVARRRDELRREWRWDDSIGTAWAVFDDDDWQLQQPGKWNDAIQRARAWRIGLIVTNPCFELWYLLHFQDQSAALTRQAAVRLLLHHLPGYEKSTCLYPDPLGELTEAATARARDLVERAARDALGDFPNPSTNVQELVQHLLTLP